MHLERLCRVAWTVLLILPTALTALPEDADQPIDVDADSAEFEENGVTLFRGTPDKPAVITQGTLRITGLEIRILERDDELLSVIAQGKPASFQQQPAIDQALVHGNGLTITLDNVKQTLLIEGEAGFKQEGREGSGHRIEYNLDTKRATFDSVPGGERVRINLQVKKETP